MSPLVDLEAKAHHLTTLIEAGAQRAARDPDYALSHGIAPLTEMSLFQQPGVAAPFSQADWLRGAVRVLLPRGWRFNIVESVEGTAMLALTGFDG